MLSRWWSWMRFTTVKTFAVWSVLNMVIITAMRLMQWRQMRRLRDLTKQWMTEMKEENLGKSIWTRTRSTNTDFLTVVFLKKLFVDIYSIKVNIWLCCWI
jgi:hypothetical protein